MNTGEHRWRRRSLWICDEIANVPFGVAGSEETAHVQPSNLERVAVLDLAGEAVDSVVATVHSHARNEGDHLLVAASVIPKRRNTREAKHGPERSIILLTSDGAW